MAVFWKELSSSGFSSSIGVGVLFFGAAISISLCTLNKKKTLQIAAELDERRQKAIAARQAAHA